MLGTVRVKRTSESLSARVALFSLLLGCEPATVERVPPQANEPSPNASILPAPLVTEVDKADKSSKEDAGVPLDGGVDALPVVPSSLREDRPLAADVLPRETPGLHLIARFRWLNLPALPRLPEANLEAAQRLRETLSFEVELDLAAIGRLRVVFDSDAFLVPRGTELRSRLDGYGHLLVWNSRYRVLPSGSLRALLTEHRADVAPLMKPKIVRGASGNVLGNPTERTELGTALGRLLLDQASVPNAGSAGQLVCRFLSDLIGADPINPACTRPLLTLRAELFSTGGGHLLFEVQRIERQPNLDTNRLLTPPADARFAPTELPESATALVAGAERIRDIRLRATIRTDKPEALAPRQGLLLQNRSESLRYALLDGIVLARMPPHSELHVEALLPGKYALSSLDFLGDEPTPLRIVELPARVSFGDDVEASR